MNIRNESPVSLSSATVLVETTTSIRVLINDNEEHWIPKSVVHKNSEVPSRKSHGELVIHNWFAARMGFIK